MPREKTYHDIDVWFNYNIEVNSRTIYLGSIVEDEGGERGVDFNLSEFTIKGLHYLDRIKDREINIIINNPGGDVYEGLAIYDAIKSCDNIVNIQCIGKVWSMAGYILQAGDSRKLHKNTSFMLHEGYAGYSQNHPRIVETWHRFDKKMDALLFEIYLNRIREKHPKFKASKLENWLKFDTIFTSSEAVEWGLADGVI